VRVAQQVCWDRGIAMPRHGLWLDPLTARELAFVSHAHADHARRHRTAVMTPQTLALLNPSRRPCAVRPVELGQALRLGSAILTLHDAGHILGSAQLLVEEDGQRLLYTGDLKLRRGGGLADTPIPKAQVLIVESTYGRPRFCFPDPDTVVEAIARWCRQALDAGVTPVLLAHASGKAQGLMRRLAPFGFRFGLEPRCVPYARAYEANGITLPPWTELDEASPGQVVVAPPVGKEAIRQLSPRRVALISGWALDPRFWHLFGADRAFPLSDHCGFNELLEVVERSGAEKVYTVHGFAAEFARHLRRRGVPAHPLDTSEQLALPF
jgi:Cft2 family RNA processing exonuclease